MRQRPNSAPLDSPAPGRRERKAMATRRAMFDAGIDAFGRRPINLVSVLDITEAADVAKGVFYLYFKNKDDFLIELYKDVRQQSLEDMSVAINASRSVTARAEAMAGQVLRSAIARSNASRFLARMLAYFPDEIGEPGQLVEVRTDYIRRLAALLKGREVDAVTESDFRLATVFEACCSGLIHNATRTGTPLPEETTFVRICSTALRSLMARESHGSTGTPSRGTGHNRN
jgi:AcrR family transcriptional regulator